MNVLDFATRKREKKKLSMITCYDYSFARIVDQSEIDCVLVGDSAAMVMHGHGTTIPADMDMMASHTAAVVRGAPSKFVIGDLPFLSYRKGLRHGMDCVEKLMKAGAHAVKLEGVSGNEELIRHIVGSGVPVMGHIGLTPQSVHQLGGFKVQGKNQSAAQGLRDQGKILQDLGCFSLVLECVPADLAMTMTESLDIPTIGIGAGPGTDGQVLVLHDLLGLNTEFKPKFVRRFAELHQASLQAFNDYHRQVQEVCFPSEKESFK